MKVPRIIHQVWLGPKPFPAEFEGYRASWVRHHPGWAVRMWREKNLPPLRHHDLVWTKCQSYARMVNIIRLELLFKYGGIYVDTDFECFKPLDDLVKPHDFFAAYQVEDPAYEGAVANGFMGAVPGHPILGEMLDEYPRVGANIFGPFHLTSVLRRYPQAKIFEKGLFYPYDWKEMGRKGEAFPDAYAAHHWAASWMKDGVLRS